ncbi:MAG: PIN domain-containing protein [Candidatus Dormibacteraeota bacterium]|nr:PIN domain-containing protein [Candidatus Dormibacteraeota bacterium]
MKLVVREQVTHALLHHLGQAELLTSDVATVEVPRAAFLKTGTLAVMFQAESLLGHFYLIASDDRLRRTAARLRPPELRSLDAIHLASALRVRDRIEAVVAYDRRLASAAREADLDVVTPGA